MPAFLTGDELGAVKSIKYTQSTEAWSPLTTTLLAGRSDGKASAIQKLAAFRQVDSQTLLAAARADGSATVLSISENSASAETVSEWKESRFKDGQRYVGLAATTNGVYSCTSNGAFRLTKSIGEDTPDFSYASILPTRLTEWRLAPDTASFAYAGYEVELSVWNTEQAFAGPSTEPDTPTSKRKRSDALLPGEIWRAKNLPNDELNLRQPVRNAALTFLQPPSTSWQHHILVGTQLGDARRYDTRTARRPVAVWKGIGKVGGIGTVESGCHEHEAFLSDCGSNIFALDLRNGKVSYSYKGLSGAVTSLALSSSYLASTSQDRFLRLHSTFPPPPEVGQQQEKKGEVLDKLYMKVVPTCIVADPYSLSSESKQDDGEETEDEGGDEVWAKMEEADSDVDENATRKKAKTKKSAN